MDIDQKLKKYISRRQTTFFELSPFPFDFLWHIHRTQNNHEITKEANDEQKRNKLKMIQWINKKKETIHLLLRIPCESTEEKIQPKNIQKVKPVK